MLSSNESPNPEMKENSTPIQVPNEVWDTIAGIRINLHSSTVFLTTFLSDINIIIIGASDPEKEVDCFNRFLDYLFYYPINSATNDNWTFLHQAAKSGSNSILILDIKLI